MKRRLPGRCACDLLQALDWTCSSRSRRLNPSCSRSRTSCSCHTLAAAPLRRALQWPIWPSGTLPLSLPASILSPRFRDNFLFFRADCAKRSEETMNKRTTTAVLLTAAIALLVGIKVGGQSGSRAVTASALPPSSIPTFSTENIGRMAHFYVGGNYVGEPGKEYMDGAMYVELWVPKQGKQPYPIVMFHGNGQTGAVFQQTPDGRPGWGYYLIDQGYVVYMVDYPARGRSPYVPSVDGQLGMRRATELSQIWTGPVPSGGDFPRKAKYTQWPSNAPADHKSFEPCSNV